MLDFILDIFFPSECAFCGKLEKNGLCEKCEKLLNLSLKKEFINDKYFEEHIYIMKYEGDIRQKILAYKFSGKGYMYKTFARIILKCEKIRDILKSYDIIVPVPIHKFRKNQRGYNQSALIAKEIAKNIENIQYVECIKKVKNNKRQSSLDKEKRLQNVKDVYQAINCEKIKGKKIVLFDDIYTTGSTANECSKILRQNGAKCILVLSLVK